MNWLAVTLMTIWIAAAVGAVFAKTDDCFAHAFLATLAIGAGYMLANDLF